MTGRRTGKEPLRWTGIVFAFAANLLLVTLAHMMVLRLGPGLNFETIATVLAPVVAGIATAVYTRHRGGMHAFAGSVIALPIMAIWVFPGNLPMALFATAFCILSASITELLLRRGQPRR